MSKSDKKRKLKLKHNELQSLMMKVWNRAQSELCEVRNSPIHGSGVYASQNIEAETKVIEYVGLLIDCHQNV